VRAGSAHAAVPEEETCVGLDHPEGVATGAWRVGHGVVDVGFWAGIGVLRFSRKGNADQLKNDGDLKERGDNVPEELECVQLKRADSKVLGGLDGQGRRQERGGEI
jgi:hypothetical protein